MKNGKNANKKKKNEINDDNTSKKLNKQISQASSPLEHQQIKISNWS